MLRRLHADAATRIERAFAPGSRGALGSALRAFARFARACPERVLFKSARYAGDREHAAWNEWTFVLMAAYLRASPSGQIGRPIAPRSIASYVSLLKGYLSVSYDFELPDRSPRLTRLLKSLASEDPLVGMRKKRRALRRRHLRRMWRTLPEVRRDEPVAANEHALLATAWHVLARGGELAPDVRVWEPQCGPSRADLSFGRTSEGKGYAVLWLRPLKRENPRAQPKVPQYIVEHDGRGSDAYAALRRLVQLDPVADARKGEVPLFRKVSSDGSWVHMSVSAMRGLVRERGCGR